MDDSWIASHLWEILGIAACLVGSFFFSGAEASLMRVPENRARHLVESDPQRYGILKFWLERKRRILTTLLVGNNLVNILCSILAYRVALRYLPDMAEAVSVFGITFVILVFAEITPKSLALHYPERAVVPLLHILWVVDKLFWIVSWPLSRIPTLFIGRDAKADEEPQVTEGEIEYQIRLGHDQSVFEERQHGELLMSVVDFSKKSVKEVMVPRTSMFCLNVEISVQKAIDDVNTNEHSRIPVYRNSLDDIVGVLFAKDLLKQVCGTESERFSVGEVMRKPPFFIPETQKISDLLAEMMQRRLHMAIVVDEFGVTSGLITIEDIIEELVGEIRDEFDDDEPMIRKVEGGAWIADARMSIHDFKDITGIVLPDSGEYESVGGFVIAQHGSIPQKDEVVEISRLKVTILSSDARHIEKVRIEQTKIEDAPGE